MFGRWAIRRVKAYTKSRPARLDNDIGLEGRDPVVEAAVGESEDIGGMLTVRSGNDIG
jgi:hypothetical protein